MIPSVVLQSAVELSRPENTLPQVVFAVLLLLLFAAFILITYIGMRRRGMSEEQSEHKASLYRSLRESRVNSEYITDGTSFEDVKALCDLSRDSESRSRRQRVASFLARVRGRVSAVSLPAELAVEGILYLILGLAVVAPLSLVERTVTSSPSMDWSGFDVVFGWLAETMPVGLILVLDFLISTVSGGTSFAYSHPYVVTLVLFAGAGVVYWASKKVEGDDVLGIAPSSRMIAAVVFTYVFGVWFAGAVSYTIASQLGRGADLVGLISIATAVLGFLGFLVYAGIRVYDMYSMYPTDELAYALSYTVAKTIGVLAVPGVVYYGVTLFSSGRASEISSLILSAPLPNRVAFAAAGMLLVGIVLLQVVSILRGYIVQFRLALARGVIKIWMLKSGIPVFAVVIGTILLSSLGLPVWQAVLFGTLAAVGVRVLYNLYTYLKYTESLDRGDSVPARVFVSVKKGEDANGNDVWVAELTSYDTHRIAAPSPEKLSQAIYRDAQEILSEGSASMSVESKYHERATEFGLTDYDETTDALRNIARVSIVGNLRLMGGEVSYNALESLSGERIPEDTFEDVFRGLRKNGKIDVIRGDVILKESLDQMHPFEKVFHRMLYWRSSV